MLQSIILQTIFLSFTLLGCSENRDVCENGNLGGGEFDEPVESRRSKRGGEVVRKTGARQISRITIDIEPYGYIDKARKEANTIIERYRKNGESFSELVTDYSIEEYQILTYRPPDGNFDEIIYSMNVGDISEPIFIEDELQIVIIKLEKIMDEIDDTWDIETKKEHIYLNLQQQVKDLQQQVEQNRLDINFYDDPSVLSCLGLNQQKECDNTVNPLGRLITELNTNKEAIKELQDYVNKKPVPFPLSKIVNSK